jgi:hypothetical protein
MRSSCGLGVVWDSPPGLATPRSLCHAHPIGIEEYQTWGKPVPLRRRHADVSPPATRADDAESFPWRERVEVATDRPRRFVNAALWGEIYRGRVESDGNGKIRLRVGALPEDVIEALALFCD